MTKMRSFFFIILTLVVCGAICSCVNVNGETGKVYMHYFTVPTHFSNNSTTTAAVEDLKEFLIETVGGYSELGVSEGGWMNDQGMVEKEEIISFMVSNTKNFSEDLKQYLSQNFNQQYPYVIVWEVLSE